MKRVIDLSEDEAREYFLKSSSYFNSDLPPYLSFDPILKDVYAALKGKPLASIQASKPALLDNVNYKFVSNKDGRFAWRPFELIHPAIYVSLIDLICNSDNWKTIKNRISTFEGGIVECCSDPVISIDQHSDTATQVKSWWKRIEQRSLEYSLEFSHLLHTDVTDCYGSLYTHSIEWAIHGLPESKDPKEDTALGDNIDRHIRAGRYGQTNGIPQGSTLMDFIAELVLSYVDGLINDELKDITGIRILRYRDDYRIFANSDESAEFVLRVTSDKLRSVGMRLSVSKTFVCRNVVEGSVKPDKIAGMKLQDLGNEQAKTLQKRLLRLHSFGQQYPNSGAIRRLMSDLQTEVFEQTETPEDLEVQIAIVTDIGFVSPSTFPAVAGIVSHLLSLANNEEAKAEMWEKVRRKMSRVPYNGYLELWLQRIIKPSSVNLSFESAEPLCQIADGKKIDLWDSSWISDKEVQKALDVQKALIKPAKDASTVIEPDEIRLFKEKAWAY